MRTGVEPFEYKTPQDLIAKDFIGTNSGNLIYAHGIYRNLIRPDVEIHADNYRINLKEVEKINAEYDGYILALADAIREDFVPQLKQMTKMIRLLKIPVYLIGMGVRAAYGVDAKKLSFPFDNVVKEFVTAVLEKSTIVGLRGHITAQYLSNLGFTEGEDHMVIGCPSMYTFGDNLKIKDIDALSSDSIITTNMSKPALQSTLKFITQIHEKFPNATFIPQGYDEFKLLYAGASLFSKQNYPSTVSDIQYANGRAKFFLNAPTWIEYLRNVDLSFGTKLHGNITALIAGTPAIAIPLDARMQELITYHNLPYVTQDEVKVAGSIQNILDKVDIHSPEYVQKENYSRFISFLKSNGLNPVIQSCGKKVYADTLLEEAKLYPPVEGSIATTEAEKANRMVALSLGHEAKEQKLRKQLSNANSIVRNERTEINKMKTDYEIQKREYSLIEKENELLKRENAIEKKENEMLKAEFTNMSQQNDMFRTKIENKKFFSLIKRRTDRKNKV